MEDAHTTLLKLDQEKYSKFSFFAVFDGHGGSNAAHWAGENLFKFVISNLETETHEEALKQAYLKADEALKIGKLALCRSC